MISVLNHTYPIHETVFKRSWVKLVIDHFFFYIKKGAGVSSRQEQKQQLCTENESVIFPLYNKELNTLYSIMEKKPMHPFYLTTKLCDRALIRVKKIK